MAASKLIVPMKSVKLPLANYFGQIQDGDIQDGGIQDGVPLLSSVQAPLCPRILTTIQTVCKCVLTNMSFSSLAAAIPLQS